MSNCDMKKIAADLLEEIDTLSYEPSPLEIQGMKGISYKISCTPCKVTEGNIKYLELILRRAMRNG